MDIEVRLVVSVDDETVQEMIGDGFIGDEDLPQDRDGLAREVRARAVLTVEGTEWADGYGAVVRLADEQEQEVPAS